MSTTINMPITKTFDYGFAHIKDFRVPSYNFTHSTSKRKNSKQEEVNTVELNGRPCVTSERFWTSLKRRFGFSSNVFRYFTHGEVFQRISEKSPNDVVRYCIEKDEVSGQDTILAVTNPTISSVTSEQLNSIFNQYGTEKLTYSNGIVSSMHTPRVASVFAISGDEFINKFVIDTPIDGFGKPNIYLAMIRLICYNGSIAYDKAFRSEISAGKSDRDTLFSIARAMDGFNNEEGFTAIRDRFESAGSSWASVSEAQILYKLLVNLANRGKLEKVATEYDDDGQAIKSALPIFHAFHKMTGDITRIYGLANLDSLSAKRQRTLPIACKVYDLLNFVTEVATHKANTDGSRRLQGYVGRLISSEYDLEGTADQFSDWRDFFVHNDDTINTVHHLDSL